MSGDPLAVTIPFVDLVLHTDALLALAGVAVGMAAFRVAARARELTPPPYGVLLDVVFWAVVAGRVWYLAEEWPFYARYPLGALNVLDGGLSVPGLAIGAAAALWGMRRLLGQPLHLPVVLAPALAAGRAVQSAGCVLTGCLEGRTTTLPWAAEQAGALRHPVALYVVLVFAAAWLVSQRFLQKDRPVWPGPASYVAAEIVALLLARFATSAGAGGV